MGWRSAGYGMSALHQAPCKSRPGRLRKFYSIYSIQADSRRTIRRSQRFREPAVLCRPRVGGNRGPHWSLGTRSESPVGLRPGVAAGGDFRQVTPGILPLPPPNGALSRDTVPALGVTRLTGLLLTSAKDVPGATPPPSPCLQRTLCHAGIPLHQRAARLRPLPGALPHRRQRQSRRHADRRSGPPRRTPWTAPCASPKSPAAGSPAISASSPSSGPPNHMRPTAYGLQHSPTSRSRGCSLPPV